MYQPDLARVAAALALIALAPAAGLCQSQRPDTGGGDDAWEMPRLLNGQPDLQGFWTTQTFTPLQRPEYLAEQEFYSSEEWAQLQAQLTAEGVDPLAGGAINQETSETRERTLYQENRDATYVHYDNEIWLRTPVPKGLSSRRTSLITDPHSGRIPPQTEAARTRASERAARQEERGRFDGHELRPLAERCIAWPHNGPPMLPPAYNDIHQILQTPDYVVVFTELSNHMPRVIPLYDRPALSEKIRMFPGDSRGRWEGDTLVVETRNFTDKTRFRGSTENLHVVERFTRIDTHTIRYEFTVSDPATWLRPWSAEIPMIRTDGPMYEYACHEGNHDIRHILEIYRNLERQEMAASR